MEAYNINLNAYNGCASLPGINELLQSKLALDVGVKGMSPNTARRHSVAFPLPKIELLPNQNRDEDSCPSSPSQSPSSGCEREQVSRKYTSSRRASVDSTLEDRTNKDSILQVQSLRSSQRISKRRRDKNYDEADEAWTDDDEKPKKLRGSSSASTNGPKYSKAKGKNKGKLECEGETCLLCKSGAPYYLHKSMNPGWRETVLAVFEYFPKRITESEWRKQNGLAIEKSLEEQANEIKWLYFPDAYAFLEYHWDTLCPPQHRNRTFVGTNWRKTIQDTLSHNRTFFISGKEIFGKTGFWRLAPKAPSQICANILNGDKATVDYNINSDMQEKANKLGSDHPFHSIFRDNNQIKEEIRDVPLNTRDLNTVAAAAECHDFSKFELLVAAIDHLESMNQ